MTKFLSKLLFLTLLGTGAAWAAPTAQLDRGATRVALEMSFLEALSANGIDVATIDRGALNTRTLTLRFPVRGGAVDAGTVEGDIFHVGGLSLSRDDSEVSLLNFTIETYNTPDILTSTERSPQLTGVVVLNGDTLGRFPLFDLDLSNAAVVIGDDGSLKVRNVGVTISAAASLAIDTVFGTGDITGLDVGVARVSTMIMGLIE
ncbi:MAG: hypothetical protein AAGI11_05630 [Pseudomonadota bacterium]